MGDNTDESDEDGDGLVDCVPTSWIADGLCDGADQAFGADLSCYGCDGGDCGQSNEAGDGCEEVDCAADWAGCLESLAVYDEYNGTNWAAECAECADTCAQNPDVPMLTDACYAAAFNIGAGVCEDPCAEPPLEWDAEVTGLTAEGVIYDEAVFTVPASIGLQGIRLAEPTLGENFLIIGLGLIGLLTAQLLKANGCNVYGLDL